SPMSMGSAAGAPSGLRGLASRRAAFDHGMTLTRGHSSIVILRRSHIHNDQKLEESTGQGCTHHDLLAMHRAFRPVPQYDRTKFQSPAPTPIALSSKSALRLRKPCTKMLYRFMPPIACSMKMRTWLKTLLTTFCASLHCGLGFF